MKRRYRGPILWSGLGAVVVLAYVLSQPVPIPIDGYQPPAPATAPEVAAAGVTTADATTPAAPVAADAADAGAANLATEPRVIEVTPQPVVTAPPVVAPPVPQAETLYVSATSLNLRAAPAAGAEVLELLPRGTPVSAIGATEGWREVINPATGTRGWMSAEFLVRTPPENAAPAATTPAPAALAPAPAAGANAPLVLLP